MSASQPKLTARETGLAIVASLTVGAICFVMITLIAACLAGAISTSYMIDPKSGKELHAMSVARLLIGIFAGTIAGVFTVIKTFKYFRKKLSTKPHIKIIDESF